LRLVALERGARERFEGSPHPLPHLLVQRVADAMVGVAGGVPGANAQEAMDALETAIGALGPDCADWPDHDGNTPLHWAVCHLSVESVELLLDSGADPSRPNAIGSGPFDPFFFEQLLSHAPAHEPRREEAMRAFIERQALDEAVRREDGEGDGGDSRGSHGAAGRSARRV
jgi:hypothetical protein